MNFSTIFQRAFDLTRSYRALWLFGFLFAVTSLRGGGGNGGGGSGGGGGSSLAAPVEAASKTVLSLADSTLQAGELLIIGAVVLLTLLVVVVFSAVHVISDTAMIRMVDGVERTGERAGVARGFRLGWSRAAWRNFLIDLLLSLAAAAAVPLLFAFALSPLLVWLTESAALRAVGTVLAVALIIPVILVIITGVIALTVLKEFFHRATAIEGLGVFPALRRGWQVAWMRIADTILMALVLFCVGLAAMLILLPVFFVVAGVGAVAAGVPGVIAGLIAALFTSGELPLVVGIVVGLPIFILVVTVPMGFFSGLVQVFSSSSWTLAYRELINA